MIFVTVGTERFQFDRLLEAIDQGIRLREIDEPVFAQTGNSNYVPELFKHHTFLPFDEMVESIKKADIVVAHAGVGSVLLCLSLDKIPIAFPRLMKLGEHLDDHQLEFTRRMETQKKILAAYDEQDLLNKIKNYENLINKLNNQNSSSSRKNLLSFLKSIIEE